MCNSALETSLHLLTVCPFAKSLWFQSHWGVRIDLLALRSTSDFVNFLLSPPLFWLINVQAKRKNFCCMVPSFVTWFGS